MPWLLALETDCAHVYVFGCEDVPRICADRNAKDQCICTSVLLMWHLSWGQGGAAGEAGHGAGGHL